MSRLMRLLCALASLLGIAGCDVMNMQEIKPGVTTGYEVRDRMGAPNTEWQNADGTVTWEYSRQPEGVECFMITIGSDNVVKAMEQVITPANMARIQSGWTKEQVRRLLGKQRSVETFRLKNEEVWDWRIPTEQDLATYFNVHFDMNGVVVRTSKSTRAGP